MKTHLLAMAAVMVAPCLVKAQDQRAVLMDTGLGIPYASFVVPEGFQLRYEIAHNPQTGQPDKYFIELENAVGSLIRVPEEVTYAAHQGTSIEQAVEHLFGRGLHDITDLEFGEMVVHEEMLAGPIGQRAIPALRQQGMELQAWSMPFQGRRGDALLQGRGEILHSHNPNHEGIGSVKVRILMCDAEQIDPLLAAVLLLDQSFQSNPVHQQAMVAIQNEVMRKMTVEHNQRMANQQQMFDAHQQKMRGIYAANEAQNRQWRENFSNSWETGGGQSFNEAWRDTLTGQTTFNDPATGHQVKQDGHYNHWYTDGSGNYQGSDDSSFNPGQGWQRIEPVGR